MINNNIMYNTYIYLIKIKANMLKCALIFTH